MTLFKEHRLLNVTQAQLDARRMKAKVTVQNAPEKKPGRVMTNKGVMKETAVRAATQQANKNSNIQGANVKSFLNNKGVDTRFINEHGVDTRTLPRTIDDGNGNAIDNPAYAQMTNAGTLAQTQRVGPIGTEPFKAPTIIEQDNTVAPKRGSLEEKRLKMEARKQDRLKKLAANPAAPVQGPVVAPLAPTAVETPSAPTITTPTAPTQNADGTVTTDATQTGADQGGTDPVVAGMGGLLANLPPEAQALAPFFENILSTISQGQADQAAATQALLQGGTIDVNGNPVEVQGVTNMYDAMDKKIADMESGYVAMQQGIQGMLDKTKESQDKYISEQEKAAKDRIAWNKTSQLRQAATEKTAAEDARIARLCLTGGVGSDGGLREIEEVRSQYESRIDDIKTEFGIQDTELAAKFTGMYVEASNNYTNASISNIKDTTAALERNMGQSLASTQARGNAEQTIISKFVDQNIANRKEYAGALASYAGQMQTMVNQSRDDKRAQEQLGWQRMEWASKTYGSDTPQAIIDSIAKQLPGVDIKGALSSMTLAEMKLKKVGTGGGGGGGLSFPSYLTQGTGQPPTFESFLADKEKTAMANGAVKFDTSAAAIAGYKKEYEATLSAANETNPTEILNGFEQRAAAQNLSGPVYKRTRALIEGYIKNGQYAQAAAVVSNIGDDVPSAESTSFENAISSRNQIQRLHSAMADLTLVGPIAGKLRNLNPYDERVVRVKNMITQTVPGLARGIFHEVGVLTDDDVARYTRTLENPDLTIGEAQNAYNELMKTIDTNIQTKLKVWDANNKRTAGYKAIFVDANNDSSNDAVQSTDDAYAHSILQIK